MLFCKNGVLNRSKKFTKKTLVLESLIKKSSRLQTDQEETLTQLFSCEICQILRTPILKDSCKCCK